MATLEDKRRVISDLKKVIATYLKKCDESITPFVCGLQSTPKGYKKVEQLIINQCIINKYRVGEAIMELEHTLNPNLTND
jgi:hypothetical protein